MQCETGLGGCPMDRMFGAAMVPNEKWSLFGVCKRSKYAITTDGPHWYLQGDGDFLYFFFCSQQRHGKGRLYWLLDLIDELDLELVMIN